MKARTALYSLVLSIAVIGGVFVFGNSSAHAAINGENGPIIYIENNPTEPQENEALNNNELNQILTTDSSGDNEKIAAESEDPITAAGISPPTSQNNYDIAYATETDNPDVCQDYEYTCASINKVTVDQNGNPIMPASNLATVNSLFGDSEKTPSNTWATNLSYSPDGNKVLTTVFSTLEYENMLSAIYEINNTTGIKTEIVSPRSDPCLNGGFADNGNIFYSQLNYEYNYLYGCQNVNYLDSEVQYDSDIWLIKPGQGPINLTNSPNISEFFIDVSSDNKYVLVADVNGYNEPSCGYALNFIFKNFNDSPFSCTYYLINTETGESTPLSEIPYFFVPAYFSPDNTSLIGTYLINSNNFRGIAVDTNLSYTASFNLTTKILTALTNTIGVQQWSPKVSAQTNQSTPSTTNTAVIKKVDQKTLPATGANSYIILLVSVLLITGSAIFFVKK